MQNTIDITFQFPLQIIQKERWYVASCPVLDVYSQGETSEQARKNLIEALTLFITSCFERGTLDAVLKESGFRPYQPSLPTEGNMIRIPIHLLQQPHHSSPCHV